MKLLSRLLFVVSSVTHLSFAQAAQPQMPEAFIVKKSKYDVTETLDKLEAILKQKDFTIFTRVNHSEGAKNVGLKMAETQLLIFGNPKAGTLLMNEQPLMALDLPLKAIAWKDDQQQTWLAYVNPAELQRRHGIKNDELITKMQNGLHMLTDAALK